MSRTILKANNINVFYGQIQALYDVCVEVHEGKIVSFIGANGAGKTTTLKTLSNLIKAKTGEVIYIDGNGTETDLQKIDPADIIKLGIAHVPEGRQVFANLSVEDNLLLGAYIVKDKEKIKENLEEMYNKFPRLLERRKQLAGTLSGGEQQMLAIARALMSNPKFILLDEPSMGLSPILVKEVFDIIKEIKRAGTTVLLVEQNAKMALSISNYAYVLETGKIVLEGHARDLLQNDNVRKAYLGM